MTVLDLCGITFLLCMEFILLFGPAHPSAHGVMRCLLLLSGDWCLKSTLTSGLLHRSTEVLAESRQLINVQAFFDRLDYVSMLSNEHAFILCLESQWVLSTSLSTSLLRVTLLELTRVLNHLLAIGCHAGDLGATNAILFLFEDRELLYSITCIGGGGRLHGFNLTILLV